MDCTKCSLKGCRKSQPCLDQSSEYIQKYSLEENKQQTTIASQLIDNGRAGTLSRVEEIVEYSKKRSFTKLGVAYCYGLEKEATLLREYLESEDLKTIMVSCTVDGIKEAQIDQTKTKNTISCNPLGQANRLNSSGAQLTILMGLCLGHDILIQKNLTMDFTTFVVKDRMHKHQPLFGLTGIKPSEDIFIENLPNNFNLIKCGDLKSRLENQKSPEEFYLVDLRSSEAFLKDGIPGSVNCLLKNLPSAYTTLLPKKHREVIIYCNGGIQSIYAVMFLSQKGYTDVKSLVAGYSRFLQL